MATQYSITAYFGRNLAELLAKKLLDVYPRFDAKQFIDQTEQLVIDKTYTQRVGVFAGQLKEYLPSAYDEALSLLVSILGDKNPNSTGMFKHYYWVLPIGRFIQEYGLDHFELSMEAIEEVTQRNTGEYAVRPFIRKYPEQSIEKMEKWAKSPCFHLRRLASEGLRPKLPWAPKLDTFIDHPAPVFAILELLKQDEELYVKKSVANHLTDWLKVNQLHTIPLIQAWSKTENHHTQWILKRATRKIKVEA